MTTGILLQVGAMVTLTKVISEADVALFTLVTNDRPPAADEPLTLDEGEPGPVPGALVAALLACAAVQVAGWSRAGSLACSGPRGAWAARGATQAPTAASSARGR